MAKVTSKDFQRNTGLYQEKARKEPVIITRYGRDSLVLLDAEEYAHLKTSAANALDAQQARSTDE